ncbi:Reverse transcriptase (RNA-dependent DNA polymerase) [Fragilaria crotonensis]|nr:Reverse transcriptase (RNA-dependent DNA polymerase) [Fragilaria crotonensis]
MELALREGAEVQFGRVVKRLRDKDGLPIGTANDNPILDTRMYKVEFQDGHKASMAANAIAENLFSQIDDEGNRHVLLMRLQTTALMASNATRRVRGYPNGDSEA